jgi:PST family polysaccharide transporter
MNLVKTSLLNSIAVLFRLLSLLGINKALALFAGPAGLATFGQFYNAVQMLTTFASGAINTGVTRFTAEHAKDDNLLIKTWQTAGTISLIGSLFFSVVIIVFHKTFANYFLHDDQLGDVFLWLGFSLTPLVLNTLLLAILNGKKLIPQYVLSNVIGSLFSLALTFWLSYYLQLRGALVAFSVYQSLSFFSTIFICRKYEWLNPKLLFGRIDWSVTKSLLSYTLMALTTALVVPFSHILIRTFIGQKLGWIAAGYWEALWKFSSAYLMFITSTLSVYYLPRISELKTSEAIRQEIFHCFKWVFPLSILISCIVYFLREPIIYILFSSEFEPIQELFLWQLMGDTLKIGSWILSFVFVAKGIVTWYVICEILCSFSFYFFILWLEPIFGLEATTRAHVLNYILYFLLMYEGLRRRGYVK